MSLVVLDLSGVIDAHLLHVRPLRSSALRPVAGKGFVPPRLTDPGVSQGRLDTLMKARVAVRPAPAQAVEKPQPVYPESMELLVVAARGSCWIEARRQSATGQQLYAGTLARGKHLRLEGKRIWVRFGALANVDLRIDGKPVRLVHTGTVDALFASRTRPA
jgi:hypothetical protein